MKKEDLQKLNKLCKQAYAKAMLTQHMLNGLNKEEAITATKLASAQLEKFHKVAAYRKGVIKNYILSVIKK